MPNIPPSSDISYPRSLVSIDSTELLQHLQEWSHRWSPAVASSMHLVFVVVASHCNHERRTFVSQERISALTGYSSSTVKRVLRLLVTADVLRVHKRKPQGWNGWRSNMYEITMDGVEVVPYDGVHG